MPIKFTPIFNINAAIAKQLMRIEAAKEKVNLLPINPTVLSSLRETAKLYTTHYSTAIEGNALNSDEVKEVIELEGHFPGRERDEKEVKGYYAALAQLEQYAAQNHPITEKVIQTLHALVMSDGRARMQPTPYREGQNVIKDGGSGTIIYMPPESKDVPGLMRALVSWLYPNNFKSWFWATRKLSEFVDLKWPNIRNMRSFKIGKLRRFGAAENPTFEVVWV